MTEYIKCAAIKIVGGPLFTGKNHSVCLIQAKNSVVQGFIASGSSRNRFVDRKEALEIATKAGQRINKYPPLDELLSEDLAEDEKFDKD